MTVITIWIAKIKRANDFKAALPVNAKVRNLRHIGATA